MSATILRFPAMPRRPSQGRIVVVDSRDHGCLTCPVCGRLFKQDLGYWPHHYGDDGLEPVCLDCGDVPELQKLGAELWKLQERLWWLQGEERVTVTRLEIPWPGGTITLFGSEVVFAKEAPPPRRIAQ